ncbi:Protein of unknown function (DUF1631) [Polaromonas sp. CF318]|uniref:DUF1631 family protein n=1 Tax=Polaromonas sp. CF318 TaxID=1144318 RepID=UPI0002713D33|nr:Protein of unknown function (DUF1631) [Polaromonas sp. CF318]
MPSNKNNSLLVEQARALFTERAARILPVLAKTIQDKLSALVDQPGSARDMQERRDGWMAFQKSGDAWVRGTAAAWANAQAIPAANSPARFLDSGKFELMDNDVMEDKILASRLALRLLDFASWELNDLRLRIQNLEGITELHKQDILRPEVLAQHLVEQWGKAGLPREVWLAVQSGIQKDMGEHLLETYHATNEFLVQQGVMAEIDLRPLVKRTPSAAGTGAPAKTAPDAQKGKAPQGEGNPAGSGMVGGAAYGGAGGSNASPSYGESTGGAGPSLSGGRGPGAMGGGRGGVARGGASGVASSRVGGAESTYGGSGGAARGAAGAAAGGGPRSGQGGGRFMGTGAAGSGGVGGPSFQGGSGNGAHTGQPNAQKGPEATTGPGQGVYDETRLQTATTPLARARMRAQGVMGQLKRLLSNQAAGFDDTRPSQASPQLAQAMASVERVQETGGERTLLVDAPGQVYGQAQVDHAVGVLRERTTKLKEAASTSSEKATIEIVALMFQSILAEDRIPAVIRVWFARLQMPVLRVAISEPEFFESLQHPARRLIDRMGSCVLGFDVTVAGGVLEAEIKRVVQVIEQYPETGRRVFQLVYDEFDKFLSRFLSEHGNAARVVSVAQQVEQKETMTIQYTIEMRNMLNDMSVRDEIREFLFKVWAEVLAIAAMKNGPQHEETLTLKRAAVDLVWAASAKPNRNDRARVIADLPKLLQLLRLGMSMLGLGVADQDGHLKIISDTLADAFMSKTDAIPVEKVEAMAKRLTNLEDYLSDEDVGDLPLDTDSLVTMIGIDATDIEVIADGGSHPTEAMRAWAKELQLGSWFSLDHNGKVSHVQFAWCSGRKQLHLFASADGRNFLIQARRLAAYLQAGLLVPTEEEALTVRATRDALAKLDANPERLLG